MRAISIKVVGPILFVVPVVVAVVASGLLASWQGRSTADDLAGQIIDQATARVDQRLEDYLATAVRVTDLMATMIRDGAIDPARIRDWERDQIRLLEAFGPISSITFGDDSGRASWAIRYPGDPGLEFAIKDGHSGEEIVEYPIVDGRASDEPIGSYSYNPRIRPWYRAAVEAGEPTWSPVYPWVRRNSNASTLGIAFARPVTDAEGRFLGVVSSDMSLGAVSEFLGGVEVSASGRAFLIEPSGDLVAASTDQAVVGDAGARVSAAEADDAVLRAVASRIEPPGASGSAAERARNRNRIVVEGRAHRVEVEPLGNPWGLDWRTVVIVPESDVMAGIDRLRRRGWMLGGLIAAGTLLIGVLASRAVVGPVLQTAESVRRIGSGDLDHRVDVSGTREFAQLSGELNHMAAELRDRLKLRQSLALAMEIQQKLLPDDPPNVPGLEIAGHSTYCDETGGDYYDFLELEQIDDRGDLVVALGDVMGHGVAAALLMATARGVLRSRVHEPGSLGQLMTHVNRQLAADTGGERFMTMILLIVDPNDRSIRWASAGHDSPILYDPEADCFEELPNINGLPLGIMDDSEYEEGDLRGLAVGQVMLVGTDGIWETRNARDEEFGKDRLRDLIRARRGEPAERISSAITAALNEFRGAAHQDDDITFVLIKFTEQPA